MCGHLQKYIAKQTLVEIKRARFWKQFDKITQEREDVYADIVRDVFKRQEAQVLKDLRKTKSISDVENADYFDEWAKDLNESTEGARTGIFTQSAIDGADSVGVSISFDVDNPAMQGYIGQSLGHIDDITDTTIKDVDKIISVGIEKGDSIPTISNSIEESFDAADKHRAVTIARTEVIGASNAGALEGYVQSGVVDGKEWITQIDGRQRADHGSADGQVVPIKKPFNVGGESLSAPGDPNGSAGNIINCRCAVAPVVDLTDL